MRDLLRSYSGSLIMPALSHEALQKLATMAKGNPAFDVSSTMIEIKFTGRETNRLVERTLLQLAPVLGNVQGEVRCEVSGDIDQLWFEFFTIRNGRLFRQRGEIVRQPEEEVTSE
jgi:hypothetical protein